MISFRRILVPTDFSSLSDHAAQYAAALARTHGAEIHVLHVVAPPVMTEGAAGMPAMQPVVAQPAIDALLDTGRKGIERFARDHFAGLATRSDVQLGVAYKQICEYAEAQGCDLIVIGSHARGMMHRLILGSVSKAVLEHSPCPLLMVPLRAVEPQAS